MLHDRLSGRITSDGEGAVLLVVDGITLGIDDLASILASHEGWAFELQIVDAVECCLRATKIVYTQFLRGR